MSVWVGEPFREPQKEVCGHMEIAAKSGQIIKGGFVFPIFQLRHLPMGHIDSHAKLGLR